MTKKELSQLKELNKEVADLVRRHSEIEDTLRDMEYVISDTVTGSSKYDPYTKHTIVVGSVCIGSYDSGTYFEQRRNLRKLQHEINEKIQQCSGEYSRIMRYINSIEDSLTRQIFRYRFIDGWSWVKIACEVGGDNTEDSVRKITERYLDACA